MIASKRTTAVLLADLNCITVISLNPRSGDQSQRYEIPHYLIKDHP
ncbi:hypothetical protein C4J96_4046 [Pseudomonas orientalis]|nr:hypothetical protein C4J96_4046 [Pseudomonas orientalis]